MLTCCWLIFHAAFSICCRHIFDIAIFIDIFAFDAMLFFFAFFMPMRFILRSGHAIDILPRY